MFQVVKHIKASTEGWLIIIAIDRRLYYRDAVWQKVFCSVLQKLHGTRTVFQNIKRQEQIASRKLDARGKTRADVQAGRVTHPLSHVVGSLHPGPSVFPPGQLR